LTAAQTTRWETAYGWGDHGAAGYLTSYAEADPVWAGTSNAYYTAAQVDAAFATGTPVYVESDPTFAASVAAGITSSETSRWEIAYGWGDHGGGVFDRFYRGRSAVGSGEQCLLHRGAGGCGVRDWYARLCGERSSFFASSVAAGITGAKPRWETSYGWGDHAAAGI
jgi:hypothetical protein